MRFFWSVVAALLTLPFWKSANSQAVTLEQVKLQIEILARNSKWFFHDQLLQSGFSQDMAEKISNSIIFFYSYSPQTQILKTGTWVYIKKNVILTASHTLNEVLALWWTISTVNVSWKEATGWAGIPYVFSSMPRTDLAFIMISGENMDYLDIASQASSEVMRLGFWNQQPTFITTERIKESNVFWYILDHANRDDMWIRWVPDGEEFWFTNAPTVWGDSWGPLLDQDGRVQGIAVATKYAKEVVNNKWMVAFANVGVFIPYDVIQKEYALFIADARTSGFSIKE